MSPTRLFHIDKNLISQPHFDTTTTLNFGTLLEGDDTEDKPYCAVSHVWGQQLESFTIENIPWKVPIESIDKLLFILRACAQQKYEYIWMDILCIRQTRKDPEAEKDKQREMSRMRRYYLGDVIVFGSQYTTFADHWDKVHRIVEVWRKDETVGGKKEETLKVVWKGLDDIGIFLEDAWFKRIWTLQEAVLPRRLLTSNGATMDFGFCHLIGWTYAALGTEVLNGDLCEGVEYSWIHPGDGIVNEKQWWEISQGFLRATDNDRAREAKLHPLEALVITKYRESKYEIDKLRGVYGMIDERWHVVEETDFKRAWEATAIKYITDRAAGEYPDLAPLVTMAVPKNLDTTMTWGAGESERMGSAVPPQRWINKSAKLALSINASGISKIHCFNDTAYGDGSGELQSLIIDLSGFDGNTSSSILSLLNRAVDYSKRHMAQDLAPTPKTLEDLQSLILGPDLSVANAVSSALREIFSGWHRWIVSCTDGPLESRAFLAWFPPKNDAEEDADTKARLDGCSLLWSCPGYNKWGVIVEPVDNGNVYKKVGIAFVDTEHPGPAVDVILV